MINHLTGAAQLDWGARTPGHINTVTSKKHMPPPEAPWWLKHMVESYPFRCWDRVLLPLPLGSSTGHSEEH